MRRLFCVRIGRRVKRRPVHGRGVGGVSRAGRCRDEELRIKWPNDVLCRGRKISGVLIEPRIGGERINCRYGHRRECGAVAGGYPEGLPHPHLARMKAWIFAWMSCNNFGGIFARTFGRVTDGDPCCVGCGRGPGCKAGVMKVFTLNLGNSRAAAGWFARGKIQRAARSASISPVILETVANGEMPDCICVGSVVPKTNATWRRLLRQTFPRVPVLWMDHRLDLGIPLDLKRRIKPGMTVWLMRWRRRLCGTPCIACDFGTATTFNLVLPGAVSWAASSLPAWHVV